MQAARPDRLQSCMSLFACRALGKVCVCWGEEGGMCVCVCVCEEFPGAVEKRCTPFPTELYESLRL